MSQAGTDFNYHRPDDVVIANNLAVLYCNVLESSQGRPPYAFGIQGTYLNGGRQNHTLHNRNVCVISVDLLLRWTPEA